VECSLHEDIIWIIQVDFKNISYHISKWKVILSSYTYLSLATFKAQSYLNSIRIDMCLLIDKFFFMYPFYWFLFLSLCLYLNGKDKRKDIFEPVGHQFFLNLTTGSPHDIKNLVKRRLCYSVLSYLKRERTGIVILQTFWTVQRYWPLTITGYSWPFLVIK